MVGRGKRALVLVATDLLEESAAVPLLEAMPVLARRHVVVVASAADDDVEGLPAQRPKSPVDAYAAAVAVEVRTARDRVVARLRALGAEVVIAPPAVLPEACVGAYLRLEEPGPTLRLSQCVRPRADNQHPVDDADRHTDDGVDDDAEARLG